MADAKSCDERFVSAFNAHKEADVRACFTADSVYVAPGDISLKGRDACADYVIAWMRAFPDARLAVRDRLIAEPRGATEYTFEGTHTQTLSIKGSPDIPATQRRVVGRGAYVYRAVNDAFAETELYFDQVQVLTQLGLLPAAATAR